MSKIAIDAVAGLGPDYYTSLAWQYENAREPERAREFYRKALDRNPENDYARDALERLTPENG